MARFRHRRSGVVVSRRDDAAPMTVEWEPVTEETSEKPKKAAQRKRSTKSN